MLTPSSPETWRMITRQQQEERKILSQRANLRANQQEALNLSTTHQAILHAPSQGQNPTHN